MVTTGAPTTLRLRIRVSGEDAWDEQSARSPEYDGQRRLRVQRRSPGDAHAAGNDENPRTKFQNVRADSSAIFHACEAMGLPHATWLTFRRTYSSWSHEKGVPGKVVAQLMGHANVDTTLNVYTQVLDGSLRAAVDKSAAELFTIVHKPGGASPLTD
jgi:integrase